MGKIDEVFAKLEALEPRVTALEELANSQGARIEEAETRTNDLTSRVVVLEDFFSSTPPVVEGEPPVVVPETPVETVPETPVEGEAPQTIK